METGKAILVAVLLLAALSSLSAAVTLVGDLNYLGTGITQVDMSWTNGSYTINASAERPITLASVLSGGWTCSGDACPAWTDDGVVGGAYNFDGADDYLSLIVTQDKTSVSLWYKANGTWTHVADSDGTTYVNGATANIGVYPIYINGDEVQIGKTGASAYFNGLIDEVRIYNRSLSAAEIQSLYELGSAHITDWTAWQEEGAVEDGVSELNAAQGKFFQFKTLFETNDTDVSPFLVNHTVLPSATGEDSNDPPTVTNITVGNDHTYNPTPGSTTAIEVSFNYTDSDGWDDINLTASNCTAVRGVVEVSLASCANLSNTTNTANISCTGSMQYYHESGEWEVYCNATDSVGNTASNTSAVNLTYNRLEAINITPSTIAWASILPSSTEEACDDNPMGIYNLGNAYFSGVNITGQDLVNGSYTLPVSDFSVNLSNAAGGDTLSNNIPVTITSATLLMGASPRNLYFWLEQVSIPLPALLFTSSSNWEITVFGASDENP
jgi:hypothetical protein